MNNNIQAPRTYLATLRVAARGYWFTAGGQKGSFGYFPHLRDRQGLPVYPDTQVIGDLKMAAGWLSTLTSETAPLGHLFGRGGGDEQGFDSHDSCLKAGDLALDSHSRSNWHPERFEVKSRIQINESSRTVAEHFLVDLELARLDECILEAPLLLTVPVEDLDRMAAFLRDAARLLCGFGAFRSRGYGRGAATITDFAEISLAGHADSQPTFHNDERRYYALTALTNVRSKPIDPGHAQIVPTCESLLPGQLKGWLARAYSVTFGSWPHPEQMAQITISGLYPSPSTDVLTWPPPMTTLTDADGNTKDMWGKTFEETEQQENFFSGKVRPLTCHTVTETPHIWSYSVETRMRNAVNDSFVTEENSLYAQEFLLAGTIFTGFVELAPEIDPDFAERIRSLLAGTVPRINGALFKPTLGGPCPRYGMTADQPELLAAPRPFSLDMRQDDNRITVATLRGYNTMCKRPRRGRVMVTPGSILQQGGNGGEQSWPGFSSHELLPVTGAHTCAGTSQVVLEPRRYLCTLSDKQISISSAQAGQLRLLLHPALTSEAICRMLEHRIEKYNARDREKVLCSLLEDLIAMIKKEGLTKLRRAVRDVTEQLALSRWMRKQNTLSLKACTKEDA